ncbi:unnamed protein product [Protopolystoma xenopodis]|uniref:Uncharacterized protein n=1 Tax=Protopolystoma xenopodis TaxID=117903 RepID=A0A448WZC0_9PLAT|nr:unnamed protein product [Protopolystoma xenopodis]
MNVTWTLGAAHLSSISYFVLEARSRFDPLNQWTVILSNLSIDKTFTVTSVVTSA